MLGAESRTSAMHVVRLEHGPAHLEEGLLQGQRVHRRRTARPGCALMPAYVASQSTSVVGEAPLRDERRRHHAVVRRLEDACTGRSRKPANSEPGRLEDDQVLEPADHPGLLRVAGALDGDRGGAGPPGPCAPRCGRARRRRRRRAPRRTPRSRSGRPPPARRRRRSAGPARGRSPRSTAGPSPWRRRTPSASGCRWAARRTGRPSRCAAREVAAQSGGDVDVADLVARGVAVDPDDPVLGLAVLVRAEDDRHDVPSVALVSR